MKKLAMIPARGGSKRIPYKNIKNFLGKPIIAYSIENAVKCNIFDEIMVSTDDQDIAEIAIAFGSKVPFLREKKLADDFATLSDVILDVLLQYEAKGIFFDYICCLLPTAPLLSFNNLIHAYNLILEKRFDSIIPVIEYSTPIQRALEIEDEKIRFLNNSYKYTRTQDLKKRFYDSGQFYFLDIEKFKISKEIFSENSGAIILSASEAHDIDSPEDWKMAELKYRFQHG